MSLKLTFGIFAWAKLIWFRDRGHTEVGFFGITDKENPLYVYDLYFPKQTCHTAETDFDQEDVDNFVMDKSEAGIPPNCCQRVWIHTHPGTSPNPSGTDEETFKKFDECDWAVMAIVAKGGQTYCRVKYNSAVGKITTEIPITVDWQNPLCSDWETEYQKLKVYTAPIRTATPVWENGVRVWNKQEESGDKKEKVDGYKEKWFSQMTAQELAAIGWEAIPGSTTRFRKIQDKQEFISFADKKASENGIVHKLPTKNNKHKSAVEKAYNNMPDEFFTGYQSFVSLGVSKESVAKFLDDRKTMFQVVYEHARMNCSGQKNAYKEAKDAIMEFEERTKECWKEKDDFSLWDSKLIDDRIEFDEITIDTTMQSDNLDDLLKQLD